jgi:aspartyl-tRNA synthetase
MSEANYWLLSRGFPAYKPEESSADSSKKDKKKKKKGSVDQSAAEQIQERVPVLVKDMNSEKFGDLPLIQSAYKSGRSWTVVSKLDSSCEGQLVWIRARLHASRVKGNAAFLVLRNGSYTVQATLFKGDDIPKEMIKFIEKVTVESVVDVLGKIVVAPSPIESVSQKSVEVQVHKLFVVSASARVLPLQIADAMLPEPVSDDESVDQANAEAEEKGQRPMVKRPVRLDNRFIDIRTPANHAIFKIQSAVSQYFREYFTKRSFVEVHTPKILGGTSEGGSEVFRLKYFGREACLAQSPQLYKQMCICGDLKGVFEVGPVFRAENSNTNRHLTEFVGLDFEMEIVEHYHEVLDTLWDLFTYIFDHLHANHQHELDAIRSVYPFEPLKYTKEKLVLHFDDAVKLLHEAGVTDAHPREDFRTAHEKALGKIVKEKYGVDFYIVDQYPMSARPFYTMPNPNDPTLSNSYDVFIRGEEVTSGAQRVHDPELLVQRALAKDIPVESLKFYIDSFRYGAPPHGGAGIGLERVVMLFCGLPNIRKTSLFPRDPKRISP